MRQDSTGKFVATPTSTKYGAFYKGTVSFLSALTEGSDIANSESYRVGFPLVFSDTTNPFFYSPFRVGGTAVFQLNTGKPDEGRYAQVYRIPELLAPFVLPAVTYYKRTTLLNEQKYSARKLSDREVKDLTDTLANDNPIIANAALRILALKDKLPSDWLAQGLSSLSSLGTWRQTLFVDTVLESCAYEKRTLHLEYISKFLEKSQNSEQVTSLFLGVHAAMRGSDEAKSMLLRANKRVDKLQVEAKVINSTDAQSDASQTVGLRTFLPLYDIVLPK